MYASMSKLFSSAVFHELARKGKSPLFAQLLRDVGEKYVEGVATVSDTFNKVYKSISNIGIEYEYIYKSVLVNRFLLDTHCVNNSTILPEVRAGKCRADMVLINDKSNVYEIKSARDGLGKLSNQLEAYLSVFSSVNVFTSEVHLDKVIQSAPFDVGVKLLGDGGEITVVKQAVDRPDRIKPSMLMDTLRLTETTTVLNLLGVLIPELSNTERYEYLKSKFVQQDVVKLHSATVEVLRNTRNKQRLVKLLQELPDSLRAIAIMVPIRLTDWPRLVKAVNTPISQALKWG